MNRGKEEKRKRETNEIQNDNNNDINKEIEKKVQRNIDVDAIKILCIGWYFL